MSEKKPFMDVESEFDPSLLYVVMKYSSEETRWALDHGGREILERYSDLEPRNDKNIIESWIELQTRLNPLAKSLEEIKEKMLPELGSLVLEQSDKKKGRMERAQAYLDLAKKIEDLLIKYVASKNAMVKHYTQCAQAAVNLAGDANVYNLLEKREFRDRVYKLLYPTLGSALKSIKESRKITDQAYDAYVAYIFLLKTNPVLSKEIGILEQKKDLGRIKSRIREQRILVEKQKRELYEENE